jgi:signal transduction histidine kinase
MGQVVVEAVDFVRRDLQRHGVHLTLIVADELPPVLVDEAQLKQALFNLIRNAREAMPDGGSVTVRAYASGDGVDVAVEDEGVGIDEVTRQHLFEPFFTTKEHGTGLGLAITRQIVEAHGGSISADARAEGGTRIVIHLPRCEPRQSESAPLLTKNTGSDTETGEVQT